MNRRLLLNAIKEVDPAASVILLRVTSPDMYLRQNEFFSTSRLAMPPELAEALRGTAATHLVVFTKYRTDTELHERSGHIGAGKLEGIGYYIDAQQRMKRNDTGETGVGFLAPYVYARASLFDLTTLDRLNDITINGLRRPWLPQATWRESISGPRSNPPKSSTDCAPWCATRSPRRCRLC